MTESMVEKVERGGFFWFDPFGAAPADAEVSGHAGGPIAWGGVLSWPFERREIATPFLSLLSQMPHWRRAKYAPHFQLFTDRDPDAPPTRGYAWIEWKRSIVPIQAALTEGTGE